MPSGLSAITSSHTRIWFRSRGSKQVPDNGALLIDQLLDAKLRQAEAAGERGAPERHRLGGSLYFDEPAVARLDDVHVDFRARVVVVREIEKSLAVDDADARCRHRVPTGN